LGDIVEISNLDPVRITIVGRTKAVLNTYGEELMVGNVDEAIRILNQNNKYSILEYTGTTIYKDINIKGGHEWIIEFDVVPENKELFVKDFDNTLCQLNSDYDAKRKGDFILGMPVIHTIEKGVFYEWMKNRDKLGGQNKIPRLCEKREYLESILKLVKEI